MKIENYGRLIKQRYKTMIAITTAAIIALLLSSCFTTKESSKKTGSIVKKSVVDKPLKGEGKKSGVISENKLTIDKEVSKISTPQKKANVLTNKKLSLSNRLVSSESLATKDFKETVIISKKIENNSNIIKSKSLRAKDIKQSDVIAVPNKIDNKNNAIVSKNDIKVIDINDTRSTKDENNLLLFGNLRFYKTDHKTSSDVDFPIKSSVPPIRIWDLGKNIIGSTYTLSTPEISKDVDGLRTVGAQIINETTITLESTNPVRNTESYSGMKIEAGGVGINRGTIDGDGIGMKVTDGVADNKNRIEITGDYGMYAGRGGTAINNTNGRITNDGDYAMYAENGGIAINKDWAFIQNTGDYGMYATNGGIIINEFSIQNPGDYGMVVYNGGLALNHKSFNFLGITNHGDYGMLAEGNDSVIINDLKVDNGGNYGMVARGEGSIAINTDTVSNGGDYGIVAEGIGSTAFNEGTVRDINDYGMIAMSGGQVLNDVGGTVRNANDYGISASGDGSIALNRGTVSNGGNYGMSASSRGQALNEGEITNTKEKGMYATNGGITINKGSVSNRGKDGMYASGTDSIALNRGTVSNTNQYGMTALSGGRILNEGIISNEGSYGMYAGSGESTALNRGTISNIGSNGIIAIHGGTVINQATVSNVGDLGMYAEGHGSISTNRGMVSNTGYYGMYSTNEGQIINEGIISNGNSFGMHAISNSTATNKGTISNAGDYGLYARIGSTVINEAEGTISNTGNYRMHAENSNTNGEAGSTAINRGIIETGDDNYTVMSARGDKSEIINDGTIAIDHDNSIGMYVWEGATAVNNDNGEIYLNASDGVAIRAADGTSTIINKGKIILSGTLTGILTDDKNNRAFDLNGAILLNTGTIVSDGSINLKAVDGKFILGTGGTIESNNIVGDFYADSALVLGGYEEKYTSYEALKTKNIEGNVFSVSGMFNSKIVKNGENYDIDLERKNFKDIINNSDLGKILEKNYTDNGNPLKENYYDALKSISDIEGLNEGVKDTYGMDYYPTIAKQTFDIFENSNRVITNNVIKDRRIAEIGEITPIAGVDFTKSKEDSYDNVSGYDLEIYSVYLGVEKQIKEQTRVGGILTIGKSSASYNDLDSSRNDYYYQGNIYVVHENENKLKFTSMMFAGLTDTDLERDLSLTTINETLTDNVDNYYMGIKNTLSKRWDLGNNYIEPKLELNVTHMMQGEITEKGSYGLNIDSVNSTSIETGVGVAVGKDIFLTSGSKINLEVSLTGYTELGNPYEDLNSTFKVLSDEKVKVNGYEGNDYYGDARIRASYATPELLTIYTETGYRAGDTSNSWLGSVGIKFLF